MTEEELLKIIVTLENKLTALKLEYSEARSENLRNWIIGCEVGIKFALNAIQSKLLVDKFDR